MLTGAGRTAILHCCRMEGYRNVEVEEIEYTGHGVARAAGKILFIEDALPGEKLDVTVTKDKKRYAFCYPVARHETSPRRVEPFCRHFKDCGGCTWQYLPYPDQVEHKGEFVRQLFARIGRLDEVEVHPTLSCPEDRYYRNKMEFSFTTRRWLPEGGSHGDAASVDRRGLGLHARRRYDTILDIDHCYLQPEPSNRIRNALNGFAKRHNLSFYDPVAKRGALRSLTVRTSLSGACMVIVTFGANDRRVEERVVDYLVDGFPEITSLYSARNLSKNDSLTTANLRHRHGTATIREVCGPLTLGIHPRSFYQTNPLQAVRLYELLRGWADLEGNETVYDLYSGIGSIALYLAADAGRVFGVESVAEAAANAEENARDNGISNCTFEVGDVSSLVTPSYFARRGTADLVVLDPPRAGLTPAVVRTIASASPKRVLYVSCNPSTQARDIRALGDAYEVRRVQPIDMFPQTHHIESVAELIRR